MAENKRFIIDDDGIVTDMVDLSMYIDNEDCCEKLNELNEEREIALDGIKIADELIRKYGSEELKHEWKKEVTVKYR